MLLSNKRFAILLVSFSLVGSLAACADHIVTDVEKAPASIGIAGGNMQKIAPSRTSTALSVQVLDIHGDPYAGATVTWTIQSGDGTLSAATSTTDANGYASVTFTASSEPGIVLITATANGYNATFAVDVATAN